MVPARVKAICLLSLFAFPSCASPRLAGSVHTRAPEASSSAAVDESTYASWSDLAPYVLGLAPELPADGPAAGARLQLAPATASALAEGGEAAPGSEGGTEISLFNANTHEALLLTVSRDGKVSAESEEAVEMFFKCRRSGRAHVIEPGVLRVVAAIAREYPGRVIEVISGFRTAPYGVKESKHFAGRAIDLRVRGVKLTKVRDFVWKYFADVGVGYYGPQNFIHVDYRPGRKDTAWSSAHENAPYEYNPRWAMRIRPPWQPPFAGVDSVQSAAHARELAQTAAMALPAM